MSSEEEPNNGSKEENEPADKPCSPAADDDCPLCMEEMDATDKACFPCTCVYQVCKFCWYRILLSQTPVCPGCRALYDPELGLNQFQAAWITVLENVRSHRVFGKEAFQLLQVISYIEENTCIPISIFKEEYTPAAKLEGMVKLLESEGLILAATTSFLIKSPVQTLIRRFSDEISVLYKAINIFAGSLNLQLPQNVELAYLPHAAAIWIHVLKHDPLVDIRPAYITSLCDKLDANGLYQLDFEVASKTYPKFSAVMGRTTLQTLRIQSDIATSLWRMNKLEQAENCFKEILPTAMTHLGKQHWLTLVICNEVAFVMKQRGKNTAAAKIVDQLCIATSMKYGMDHPDTITAFRNKGMIMHDMERYDEALAAFYHVLECQEKTLDPGAAATLNTRFTIASILNKLGHHEAALKHHMLVLHARKNLLHPSDPAIMISVYEASVTLNKLNRHQQALNICQEQASVTNMNSVTVDVIRLECQTAKAFAGLGRAKKAEFLLDRIRMKREGLLTRQKRSSRAEAILHAREPRRLPWEVAVENVPC